MAKYMILNKVLYKDPEQEQIDAVPLKDRIELKQGVIKNMIFENWWTNLEDGTSLDFAYYPDLTADVDALRSAFFESHGTTPICLRSIILPSTNFTEEGVKLPECLPI